ncbi:MAG: flavin reductase [Phaeodactylibacter sp.]|nr:flavin reductase [Phaeodactylibacter sp.]
MQQITRKDIAGMERLYRGRLINSLSGFKSVNLLGTVNSEGQTNLAMISSVVHIGANPPLVGFISRPISVPRHSYQNITATGFYTLNHIHADIYQQAHQTSARYDAGTSEFDATGLTAEFRGDFAAPYVAESRLKIGLQFREQFDITLNDTILVVGEIQEIWLPEDVLGEDGHVDIERAGSITCSGLDTYHKTERLQRLSYAKPDRKPKPLE